MLKSQVFFLNEMPQVQYNISTKNTCIFPFQISSSMFSFDLSDSFFSLPDSYFEVYCTHFKNNHLYLLLYMYMYFRVSALLVSPYRVHSRCIALIGCVVLREARHSWPKFPWRPRPLPQRCPAYWPRTRAKTTTSQAGHARQVLCFSLFSMLVYPKWNIFLS